MSEYEKIFSHICSNLVYKQYHNMSRKSAAVPAFWERFKQLYIRYGKKFWQISWHRVLWLVFKWLGFWGMLMQGQVCMCCTLALFICSIPLRQNTLFYIREIREQSSISTALEGLISQQQGAGLQQGTRFFHLRRFLWYCLRVN